MKVTLETWPDIGFGIAYCLKERELLLVFVCWQLVIGFHPSN